MSRSAVSSLRKRATDPLGVVHEVASVSWSLVETRCGIIARWQDRVSVLFNRSTMAWDGFDPTPEITCMACMVKGART